MVQVTTELLKYGSPGLIVLVLFFVIKTLWEDNKALREELKLLQQKRVEDASAAADRLLTTTREVSGALTASAQAQLATRESLRDFEETLGEITLGRRR